MYQKYKKIVEIEKDAPNIIRAIIGAWMIGIPLLMLLLILDLVFPRIVLIIVIWAFCGYLFPTLDLDLYDAFSNSNGIINKSEYFKIIKIGYGMAVSGSSIIMLILLMFMSQMFDTIGNVILLIVLLGGGFILMIIGAFICVYISVKKLPELTYYSAKQHPTKPNAIIKQFRYKIPIHESSKLKYIKNISANKLILISISIVAIMAFILYMIIMHIIG